MANSWRLTLPKPMLAQLRFAGVYCQPGISVERQERAKRWVLRGVESGGAAKQVGRYVAFFASTGERIEWLQRADRVGSNGVHAVVVAESLASVEVARVGETYQLLIVRYRLGPIGNGRRPPAESTVVFRGIDGQLPERLRAQSLTPEFLTRSGESNPVPAGFVEAVRLTTAGAGCVNCRHVHGLHAPGVVIEEGVAP